MIWYFDTQKIDDTFHINNATGDTENELRISPEILLELTKIYSSSIPSGEVRSDPIFTCQAVLEPSLFSSMEASSFSSNFHTGSSLTSRVRFEPFCKLLLPLYAFFYTLFFYLTLWLKLLFIPETISSSAYVL